MSTNIYLTIDTENSMGGAWSNPTLRPVSSDRRIFCKIGHQDYGIGWMCRELNARNLRATFFGEVFAGLVFGEADTRSWMQFLLDNGQDVQLHTHLNFFYYAQQMRDGVRPPFRTDNLADAPPAQRPELLERACELFRRAAGYTPAAFRAGNWRCDWDLLSDLRRAGIVVDCSFNPALQGRGSFDRDALTPNALQYVEGVWEFPITVASQTLPDPALRNGVRPFDPVSMSCWEIRSILDNAYNSGIKYASAVFHSFSGLKVRGVQYTDMKPNHIVRKRFLFLIDYLSAHPEKFRVSTIGELADELHSADCASPAREPMVPSLGFLHPLGRKMVQIFNSIYWV
jgi:hypothetical protein